MTKDNSLSVKLLKNLSRIKGWEYHREIENEKKAEIKEFISAYILRDKHGEIVSQKISYARLSFLVEHPSFKPEIKALITLIEISESEAAFKEKYQKIHSWD
jgi:hypothetical protein